MILPEHRIFRLTVDDADLTDGNQKVAYRTTKSELILKQPETAVQREQDQLRLPRRRVITKRYVEVMLKLEHKARSRQLHRLVRCGASNRELSHRSLAHLSLLQ